MDRKKVILYAFALLVFAQLFVPAKMIIDKELVLGSGTSFKFKVRPVDPNDPFRGKYITLNYVDQRIDVPTEPEWLRKETVYILYEKDSLGYAKVTHVSKEKPTESSDYLKTKVTHVTLYQDKQVLNIEFPFKRFYMEESKAGEAERIYWHSLWKTRGSENPPTYAVLSIKNGKGVLKDVMIHGTSAKDVVKKRDN